MDNRFLSDLTPLPPEIDIPDLNHNPVPPVQVVVKVLKRPPWYTPGTLEVSEKDWITEEDS